MAKFARVATPAPTWFDPGDVVVLSEPWERGVPRRGGTWVGGDLPRGGSGGSGLPDVDLPDFDLPDLQEGSDRAGKALGGASIDAMTMLKVAGAILEIAAAFAGGGSKGGSSGGGGGGFR
jgi:hypothetical protein